jgi:heptosyltransferase II
VNGREEIDGGNRIREILVRAPNWVGDNIFAIPAVQRLKREFPAARLTVLAARGPAPLWELAEGVDGVIPFELRGGLWDLPKKRRLIRRLRSRRFDLAVIFPRSFESALWVRLAGIPRRWGYGEEGRSFLLTRPARSARGYRRTPRIDYYYRLLDGGGGDAAAAPARLFISPDLRRRALDLLKEAGIEPEERLLAGFHPRASYGPAKCWPPENFARLARLLAEKRKAVILLFGTEKERELLEEIAAGAGEGTVNLAGRTDLETLAALISLCRVLVANDSGPLHLAAALGVPVVGLYGSTDPQATGPRGEKTRVIYKGVDCSPCLLRVCPKDFSCMTKIKPQEVLAAVEELWLAKPDGSIP